MVVSGFRLFVCLFVCEVWEVGGLRGLVGREFGSLRV